MDFPLSENTALIVEAVGMSVVGLLGWWKLMSKINRRKASFIRDYATVKSILQSRLMSAAPQRLTFTDLPEEIKLLFRFVSRMLLYNDGGHERLRRTYPKLNARTTVEKEYGDFVREQINKLFDDVGDVEQMDIKTDIAVKLPWILISHIAGVPEEDIPRASKLINTMGHFVGTPFSKPLMEEAAKALVELRQIIQKWEKDYMSDPSPKSLFGQWLVTNAFDSMDEYESNVVMLLFAATHNLENVLANAVRLLLHFPNQLQLLKDNPDYLDSAIEEILRFCPAIRTVPRTAKETHVFNGRQINEGQTVILSIWDANRDASVFPSPEQFDISRGLGEPPKHLTFGYGVHLCVGNALARLQIRTLLQIVFFERMPNIRLVDDKEINWEHTYTTVEHLPVYTGLDQKTITTKQIVL